MLDTDGYYRCLLAFLEHAVRQGFVRPGDLERLVACAGPDEVLDHARESTPT
ncbi:MULTISPECIES: LOG family protein [unclassified Streptomyces]|uniref:LOG family protein n=1 Tax=unclassified Streptomyces TaxID=2593676 RepID=UPI00340A658A